MIKKTKKYSNCIKHSIKRAKERYKLELTELDIKKMSNIIYTNKAQFISRTSNNFTIWSVVYSNTKMNVVYDKKRKLITTILPLDINELNIENIEDQEE